MRWSLGDNIFAGPWLEEAAEGRCCKCGIGKRRDRYSAIMWMIRNVLALSSLITMGQWFQLKRSRKNPKSNYCVTGLYFYDNHVVEYAKSLKPSARGELEITDLNKMYLEHQRLHVELLGQGFTWLDTGTHESLVEATNFVKTMESHQHRKIALPGGDCLPERVESQGKMY